MNPLPIRPSEATIRQAELDAAEAEARLLEADTEYRPTLRARAQEARELVYRLRTAAAE